MYSHSRDVTNKCKKYYLKAKRVIALFLSPSLLLTPLTPSICPSLPPSPCYSEKLTHFFILSHFLSPSHQYLKRNKTAF